MSHVFKNSNSTESCVFISKINWKIHMKLTPNSVEFKFNNLFSLLIKHTDTFNFFLTKFDHSTFPKKCMDDNPTPRR